MSIPTATAFVTKFHKKEKTESFILIKKKENYFLK